MTRLEEFARIFELPPAMLPHIRFVADEQEMDLVIGLNDRTMTVDQIAEMLGMPLDEAQVFVRRAYTRAVIEKEMVDGVAMYRAGTFYERLNPLSMYEAWGDVPADARDAVIQWQLQEFIDKWQPTVQEIMRNPDVRVRIPNRDILLLDEALEMVEAATEHVVVPCDCRAIVMACNRPVEACIRLDNGALRTLDHGMGRRLTKEECKQLVVDLDRAGLMHTGEKAWREAGSVFGFCSCCACDCYPFRAGIALDMQKQWPRSHYVAERDEDKCKQCGLCTRRCHFGAFYYEGTTVTFDAEKCWGCGLCATACPEAAIAMQPLRTVMEAVS